MLLCVQQNLSLFPILMWDLSLKNTCRIPGAQIWTEHPIIISYRQRGWLYSEGGCEKVLWCTERMGVCLFDQVNQCSSTTSCTFVLNPPSNPCTTHTCTHTLTRIQTHTHTYTLCSAALRLPLVPPQLCFDPVAMAKNVLSLQSKSLYDIML